MLFFVVFEIVLVPMYFLIAVWGGEGRQPAGTKFILYTVLGSVVMLLGFLVIYAQTGTFDMIELADRGGEGIARGIQIAAFLAIGIGFAVKTPLWPLHTWLPDAHTAAPTVGSVLLAGVLLKMGTYGFVRIALPVLPDGARAIAPALVCSPSSASCTDHSRVWPSTTSSASSRTPLSDTWASWCSALPPSLRPASTERCSPTSRTGSSPGCCSSLPVRSRTGTALRHR